MDRLRAHHRRRDLRGALSAAALAACAAAAGCGIPPDEPLPPPRLEERNAILDDVAARLRDLEGADAGAAAGLAGHPDHRVRRAAALRLAGMGRRASGAVPDLVELLRDEHPRVRVAAARALGAIGDARATDPLLAALGDPDRSVRLWAWKALRSLGDAALPAVVEAYAVDAPALGISFTDEAGKRRTVLEELTERLPTVGAPLAAALEPALLGGRAEPRNRALELLRRSGRDAKAALPAIAGIAADEAGEPGTRILALRALEAIGDLDPSVLPAVTAAAASPEKRVASQAKKTLAALRKPDPKEKRKDKPGDGSKKAPPPKPGSSDPRLRVGQGGGSGEQEGERAEDARARRGAGSRATAPVLARAAGVGIAVGV